ncbi:MAG: tetratricopeptide repeat protein [Acidobacteria bacterium]|nr:tetratricopeptide repeat protein [Acidobacteriota bacterium]
MPLRSLEIVNTYHSEYSQQEDYSIAISYSVLAYLLAFDGMNIQSMEYYQLALSLLTRLDGGTDQYALNITEVFSGLGRVYYQLGDYAHSLLMLEQAIIYAGKTHLNDQVAGVYNILGTLFVLQENCDKAFEYYGLENISGS